jgi:tetratricopeptide repeat protein 21B
LPATPRQADVRYRLLMAKMHYEAGHPGKARAALEDAKGNQREVLRRIATERPEALQQEQERASDICIKIAKYFESTHETSEAVKSYQEALQHNPDNSKATLALAKLHMAMDQLDMAEAKLMILWKQDRTNTDATLMLADVAFRKRENEDAIRYFQQLLEREPDHYEALARLVDLLRRAAKLGSCEPFIEAAAKACPRPDTEPGLNYCRGLFNQLHGGAKTNEALTFFSRAKSDTTFGVRALYQMCDIYLNPADETLGGDALDGQGSGRDQLNMQKCLESAEAALKDLSLR